MSKTNGGPAFPTHEFHYQQMIPVGGMSLRDYFAAKALQGFLAGHIANYGHEYFWNYADMAGDAYQVADAMIKAREQ